MAEDRITTDDLEAELHRIGLDVGETLEVRHLAGGGEDR
jgi:hypothetical protein